MSSKISIKSILFIISLFGAIWAWMVHSSNLQYVKTKYETDSPLQMVLTADDASYVVPGINFYQNGTWKDNSGGISSYIQRPPMIGMINAVFYAINKENGLSWQKYLAVVLHGFSLFLFGLMCTHWFGKRTGILLQIIYAILPCFWGYLFYFLTESITPSLLVFLYYGYFKFQQKNSPKWLFWQGLVIGILLLTRPQLGILILPFFYYLWIYVKNRYHNRWFTISLAMFLAFSGFTLWQIRSINITHEWKGLHPIYDETNISQYRPVHRSFGEMFKIWEHNGERFHTTMGVFWDDEISVEENADFAVVRIPHKVYNYVSEKEMKDVFISYGNYLLPIYHEQGGNGESSEEKELRLKVDSLTHMLRSKMWKENYITTPLNSMQWMFTKSQLNLKIFQTKYRGQWWMEGLRYFSVILISLITLLSIFQLTSMKNKMIFLSIIGIVVYLFYLFFIQKMNEERYFMPLLPIFLLFAADRFLTIGRKLKRS